MEKNKSTNSDLKLDLEEPNKELLDYAALNIGEDPQTKDQLIKQFRIMITEKGEFSSNRLDDMFLLKFLRARNFKVNLAYKLIINYHKFRQNNSDLISHPINKTGIVLEDRVVCFPPYKDQNGRRMILFKLGNWDTSKRSVEDLFRLVIVMFEMALLEQSMQILGGVAIADLRGMSMTHAWQASMSRIKTGLDIAGNSLPIKIHSIHVLNESWISDTVYSLFKHMLSKRIQDKIHFHGSDLESLHSHIDPKYLPIEYGGIRDDIELRNLIDMVDIREEVMKEMLDLGFVADEPPGSYTF